MSGPSGKSTEQKAPRRALLPLLVLLVAGVAAGIVAVIATNSAPLPQRNEAKTGPAKAPDVAVAQAPAFGHDFSLPQPPDPPPPPTAADIEPPAAKPAATGASVSGDPASLPFEELRKQAEAHDPRSMVEMARRLILGVGIAKDPQAGAGWMLRAAELGSSEAAFNVGIMYENGFVVERNSTRAAEWYRRAADKGLPVAEHNLALLLRQGKGVPRDGEKAIKLLLAAAHQGMTASMFALGDIYEQGDAAPKDTAAAVAWFTLAAQFERRAHGDKETPLAKNAIQRVQDLRRIMTATEVQRAQDLGQREIQQIIDATSASRQAPGQLPASALPSPAPSSSGSVQSPAKPDAGWPAGKIDQVRAIQQALFDLKLLHDKPDGALGPMTRNAIRSFQHGAGLAETGEPSKDLYVALKQALTKR
ncbi:MAG: SEL1-like repeat protein [Proteobacteria bacterium]|nr:SEL1-like repeat protein [Pseudomonadota bacterium]